MRTRLVIRIALAAGLLGCTPLLAATFDVKTLIDTDNRRSTGCSVVTPGGIVNGIDVIVTTQGTVTGSTGSVTAVTRQTCTNAVLNQFGSATAVDGGWNVGVSPIGDVTVESHMGLDVLTWDNIGTPRFVFMTSSGLESDVLLTPWSWGGGDIILPHAARDRAMTPVLQRNILLDGGSSDWAGSVPLANGTASPPVWRFISASAYAGMHDLFFNFKIHTNGAAPTAHDDNYSLSTLGGTLTVATLGVLNNDNPNNQPITASLVDTTQHGTLALAPDGGFTYVHDGSLASQDQFHYVAVGTTLSSNLATVTIDLPGTHPYTFTSADNVTFIAGQTNTFQVVVTGKPTPALTVDGALPDGITFQDLGNGTGTLSGTPGPNTSGTYPLVFNADKNKPHSSSQHFTLTVTCPGVSVVNPGVTTGTAGTPFSQTFTQSGGTPPVSFALNTGTLPPGLALSTGGVLSGTPAAPGTYPITVKVTDVGGCTGVGPAYNLIIACHPVTVTNPGTSTGTVNAAFSQTFTQSGAVGGATFSLNSGTLPAGLTLSSAGVLSGTPAQPGSFPITVKVTDGQGCSGIGASYTLTIGCQTITVTNPATNSGTAAAAFSQTFTSGNTIGAVTYSTASPLPAGLTLSSAGVLSGTPTQTGTFPIVVKATDANGCFGNGATYSLTINCQTITVNNPATNTGTVNAAFSQSFTAPAAIGTKTFSLNSGTLPAGITLSSAGVLSGTPTQTGSFPITVKATDANGCSGIGGTYTLTIGCQVITVNNPATNSGTVNVPFSKSFTTTNAIGTVTFTTASTLPTGLALSTAGVLSGTPTQTGTFPIVVHAVDANGCPGNGATYSLTINCQIITVNNPATTSGAVNTAFSQNFTATNAVGTQTFSTSSTLPTGFTLAGNGTLSGTTTQSGSFPIVVSVVDGNGCTGTGATYTLVINQPPAITSANAATFKAGQAGTFPVTTTGFPTGAAMAISESGALPAGVTFVNNNNGTATLAGTPNAGTGGTYPITITANNGIAPNATQNFTLTVNQSPAITSGNSATFKAGQAGTFSVTTTGFPSGASMVISQSGPLPGGVTFVDNGDGTATLAGTPNAGTGGTYPITITANNGVTPNATQNFTLTVQQAPAITSGNSASFTAGSAGTFTVTTTGFPSGASMIISKSGSLPSGVTLVNNNDGTATLAGTPAAGTGGTYPITISADNGVTPAAGQSFTLTVNESPVITSGSSATFKVGQAGTFPVTTTGFPSGAAMVISESGALPGGVTFTDNGNGTATLAGTPNALTGGTYPIVITANNGVAPNATQNFTLTVQQAPAITSANQATFPPGTPATFTVTTTGFPTGASMLISETGDPLPGTVTFVDNHDGTATIAGTASGSGDVNIVITASNGVTPDATQNFTLHRTQPPAITSANSTTFQTGVAGTFTVTTTGFPVNVALSKTGTLPANVTFTDNGDGTATLAGTPNAGTGGSYPIVITGNNGVAPNATQNFTLVVNQPPAITSGASATFTVGAAGTFSVTTTGFPVNVALSKTGALPAGVSFTDNGNGTATLAGTPNAGTGGTYPIVITGNNGVAPNATQNFTLTVNQAPAITSANTTTFQTGVAGTFTVTTTGFPTAVALSKTGALPAGVTFTDNGNGTATLAGTPNAGTGGSYPIVITGNNGIAPNATQNFTLVVNQPPAITSGASATFTVGAAGTFSVTTTGFPTAVALSKTGALPAGVSFTDNGNGTATLAGTPNAGTGGTYPIVITGNNGVAPNATQNFTLTVNQAPAITSANTTTFQTGVAGTFTVTTTGFPTAVALSKTGALPAGVTFTDNGNGTATLAGTPNAGTGGSYPIVITGNNGVAPNATQNFTLVVNQPPAITSGASATFTVGAAGTFSVTTSGFPTAVALSKTGALPAGVTFTDNGNGTATLAGTPNAGTGGTYPIVITGNNGVAPNATQNFTLTVNQAPAITSANTTTFQTGVAGTFTVTTTGFPTAVALSKTGALPAGVTFTDNGNGTATMAGTPNAGTGGSYPIVITGNNGVAPNATQNFTLVVNQPPAITSANNATFKVGVAGTFSVTTTGFPSGAAMVISETGALPGGVTFVNNNNGTATLAGTPDPGTGGTYSLTIGANNGVTPPASQSFTLTVNQAPAITSANAVTFTTGQAGTFSVTTTGFPVNVALSKTGVLPASISFTDNGNGTATISGTPGPADGGSYPIVITGNNGVTPNATQNFTLTINQAPAITSANSVTFTQGVSGQTFTVTTTGFPANGITRTGTLPGGVTFTDNGNNTATIAGTPAAGTAGGSPYAWVITAANGVGTDATQNFTFNVTCPVITVSRSGGGSFPAGIFNSAYTGQSVTASGGTGPYTFAITSGSLPTGLALAGGGAISGTPTATGLFNFTVTATDTVSLCTGSQSFSISIAPVAAGDSYAAASNIIDNTQFVITGGTTASPATPFVGSIANILANDLPSGVTATPGTFATTGGGSVTLAADGTFIYTPGVHAGAITSDSFTYTVVSNGITSAAATVNLTLANRVWYVKNNGAAGNGQSQNPFNTLAAAQTASAIGDIIYVYNGDGLTTGQSLGIILKNNQQLIGEGVALVVNTVTLNAAGTKPQITNTTATSDVVTLADGDTIKGLTVTGATRDGIAGNTHAGFTGDTLTIQTSTNSGLHLTSMTGAVTLTNTTFSGANGIGLDVNNGTATITLDATNSITANAGKRSVSIQNRPASAGLITIGAAITDNGLGILVNNNASGTIAFTGAQTLATTTNPGVTLTSNTGTTINFSGTLNVTTTTGTAFNATGGGTLNVTGTANVTTGAVSGSGVNINGVTAGASGVIFSSVNTTGATTGVSFTSLGNGNVAINGGTISGGTTGLSMNTLGTSSVSLVGVTFTGSTTAISGTNFGTLGVASTPVSVSGVTALNLNTGAITGTFGNVSSTGGTNGVNLTAVTGIWGVTAGTLTGATGSTFNASGASAGTVSWGGAITQANGANVVTISGSHTGTINFSGNVQTSGTSTGINISGSSGTYNFTGSTNTIAGSGGGVTIGNGATESGTITFGSGTSITSTAAGAVFDISGPVATVSANVTYSGTISKSGTSGVVLNVSKYSGTLLMNGSSIVGLFNGNGSSTSTLADITGTVTINNLSLTSGFNTFSGTLLGISGTNTGSTITFNHLTLSANGSGHTGAGLVDSGTGGTVTVTGTGGASTFDTGSSALSLNGQAMGSSTIGTLTCTAAAAAGSKCVSLTSPTGSLTISGGTITGGGGAAFLVSGGSATISDAGTITQNTAGQRAVDIQTTTGSATFSGAISSTGGAGIFLNGNSGATMNFTGLLTLSTGTSPAFTATGAGPGATTGGTITATNTNNTLTTTTGIALNVANTTIGAGSLLFKSISANGGANGIILNNTGTTAGLTVDGDGANTTVGGNATGGTIQNMVGANGGVAGSGVYLKSTKNVILRRMTINGTNQNFGIRGFSVDGFTLEYSTVNGTNGGNNNAFPDDSGEGSIYFGNTTTNGIATSGTFTKNLIAGGAWDNMHVVNTAGTATMTVKGNTFGLNGTTNGNQSFMIEARGSATVNSVVGGPVAGEANTFTGAPGGLANFTGQTGTTMDVQFKNNVMSNNHPNNNVGGGCLTVATQGVMTFNVDSNSMRDADGSTVTIQKASAGTSMQGRFTNNTLGVTGVLKSASKSGNGIFLSCAGAGTIGLTITGNQIRNWGGNAAMFFDNTGGSYTVNLTIQSNTMAEPGTGSFSSLAVTNGGNLTSDTVNVCATIGGAGALKNTITGTAALADLYLGSSGQNGGHTFNLPGYGGASNLVNVQNFVIGNNTFSGGATVSAYDDNGGQGSFTGIGGSCPTP